MRCLEICALLPEDIDGDIVLINKVLVQNEKRVGDQKTEYCKNNCNIIIPQDLTNRIMEQRYVLHDFPNSLTKHLQIVAKELGIPKFSLHKLRSYFASGMLRLGVPEADILKLGG